MKKNDYQNGSKKVYQINISLCEDDYLIIKSLALYDRRTISDIARLILIDNAKILYNHNCVKITPAKFTPGRLPGDDN